MLSSLAYFLYNDRFFVTITWGEGSGWWWCWGWGWRGTVSSFHVTRQETQTYRSEMRHQFFGATLKERPKISPPPPPAPQPTSSFLLFIFSLLFSKGEKSYSFETSSSGIACSSIKTAQSSRGRFQSSNQKGVRALSPPTTRPPHPPHPAPTFPSPTSPQPLPQSNTTVEKKKEKKKGPL